MPAWALVVALPLAASCGEKKVGGGSELVELVRDAAAATRPAPDAAPDPESERVVLQEVKLRVAHAEKARELPERELAQSLGQALARSEAFVESESDVAEGRRPRKASLELLLSYDMVRHPDSGERALMTAGEARLVWADGRSDPAPQEHVLIHRDVKGSRRAAWKGLQDQVLLTLEAVASGLVGKERVRTDREAMNEALDPDQADVDLSLWALELARERKLADAYGKVAAMLESPSRDVKETAVGALMVLGDERAVEAIAKATDTTDIRFVRLSIDAAVELGGDEAVSYLEFLAEGHPESTIRKAATKGLIELKASR